MMWDYSHYRIHGGREVFVDYLVAALVAAGHEVALVTREAESSPNCMDPGSGVVRFSINGSVDKPDARFFAELNRVKSFVKEFDPEVIHAHQLRCPSRRLINLLRSSSDMNLPQVLTLHDLPTLQELREDYEKNAERGDFEAIVVPSSYMQNRLGIVSEVARVELIRHGIPPLESRSSSDQLKLLFAGRLVVEKGLFQLVTAWSKVYREFEKAQLYIFGTGPLESSLVREIERNAIADRTQLGGGRSVTEIRNLYGVNTISLQPSLIAESFGLSVLEAMSAGSPAIVSNRGALPELIRDGIDGLVVDPMDIDAIALNMAKLLKSSELRETFGRAANLRASSDFTMARCAAEYESLYKSLVS